MGGQSRKAGIIKYNGNHEIKRTGNVMVNQVRVGRWPRMRALISSGESVLGRGAATSSAAAAGARGGIFGDPGSRMASSEGTGEDRCSTV